MRALLLALAVALLAAPATAMAQKGPITMSGAVNATALTADLAYFYRRTVSSPPRFELVGGRSATGIADVWRGVTDVGLTARSLLPSDPPGLVFTPIARTGICLVTNLANPIPAFSRAQINDLIAARITTWEQVPGSPLTGPIAAGVTSVGAGSRTAFENAMVDPGTPQLNTPRSFTSAPQMRDFIKVTPHAWGYVDLAFAGELHVVAFEGTPCTRATVASGAYPALTELGYVTRGAPKGRVARFIRWVRSSRKARRVIATRYVPVQATRAS
jgi:ABC-type phosphate transport system substrate-binding protein